MKIPLRSICASTLAIILAASTSLGEDGQALFNGTDLSGWRGDPIVWSVSEGAILGRTMAGRPIDQNTFLIYETPFDNFELTFKYKIVNGNSGLQYRSKVIDETKFIVGGYQADFEAGTTYSGILYEERGRGIMAGRGQKVHVDAQGNRTVDRFAESNDLQAHIKQGDWNDYRIVANGSHLQHFINGHMTAEVIDEQGEKSAASGVIALQVHAGPPMSVYYKDLMLKPLGAPAPKK